MQNRYVYKENKCTDLDMVKKKSRNTLHPMINTTNKCTMMLLSNLAEPEWVSVSCTQPILPIVACMKQLISPTVMEGNFKNDENKFVCQHFNIRINNTCYSFVWSSYNVTHNLHLKTMVSLVKANVIEVIKTFVDSVYMEEKMSLLIFVGNYKTGHLLKLWRKLDTLKYQQHPITAGKDEGFNVYFSEQIQLNLSRLLFQCLNGIYILQGYVCDEIVDCTTDYSDEQLCICNEKNYTAYCKQIYSKRTTSCFHTYYMTIRGSCSKLYYLTDFYTLSKRNQTQKYKNTYLCKNGVLINKYLVNDLVPDCGPEGDDETFLFLMLNNSKFFSCNNPAELPCKYGHSRCYNLTDVCNFELFQNKYIMPCRNGAHLQRCQSFECNVKYKCPNNYCIPWIYVCDGKWDCPEGHDESKLNVCSGNGRCRQQYKCRDTQQMCIHLGNICDGQNDCPAKDDEVNCELKGDFCLQSCKCLLYAVYCNNVFSFWLPHNPTYISIHISNSHIPYIKYLSKILYFGRIIHLPDNTIVIICNQIIFKQCFLLDLRTNSIQFILSNCFSLLTPLISLSLCNNKIKFVESRSFYRLNKLRFLNLSNNPIWNLASFIMSNHINDIIFSITDVNLTNIDTNAFHGSSITMIITQNYYVCCLVTVTYFCSAQQPWYVSCRVIFTNIYMRLCYIFIPTLIILHNVVSIIINMSSKKNISVIISFINISHLMLTIYLIAILIGDYTLQSSTVIKEQEWRSAPLCFFAFGSILYQTISAQLLLTFPSLSRVMVVIYPIDSRFKQAGFSYRFMSFLLAGSFLTCVIVTLMFKFSNDILPNNLCLPYVDPTRSIRMIKVIAWCTVTSQSITLITLINYPKCFSNKNIR